MIMQNFFVKNCPGKYFTSIYVQIYACDCECVCQSGIYKLYLTKLS